MALFGKKEQKKEENAEDTKVNASAPAPALSTKVAQVTDRDLDGVLIKPLITEKTVGQSQRNIYTFAVQMKATKIDVRDAVVAAYGVTPVKVNIVKKSPRQHQSRMRNKMVTEKGVKKAYVYLKAGDTINFV